MSRSMKENRNKIIYKLSVKYALLLVLLVLTVAVMSCGQKTADTSDNQHSQKDENSEYAEGENICLYYVNDNWSDFNIKDLNISQLATVENLIDTVMNSMIEGGGDEALAPVPTGVTYQRYTYDGQGNVTLILSASWDEIYNYYIVLSKAAFVKTLCQIDGVDSVIYEMVDSVDENQMDVAVYDETSFALDEDLLDSRESVDIYMPDSMGQYLVKKTVELDRSAVNSLPEQIIDRLRNETEGVQSPFGSAAAVTGISLENGLCTVKVNSEFIKGKDGVRDDVLIYSIVDSLISLQGVSRVKIEVNDESSTSMRSIDLSTPFTGDYSYLR